MALVLPQSSDVTAIPVGVTTGTILVTRSNATFRGTDRDSCIVRGDGFGAYTALVNYDTTVGSVTFENCTLDCNDNADYTSVIQSGPSCLLVTLKNVRLMGVVRTGIHVFSQGALHLSDIIIQGSGAGIQVHTNATSTYLKNITVYGGRTPFTLSDGAAGTVSNIRIHNFKAYLHYWESPTYETATITAFGAKYVDVASHVEADRSFADCLRMMYHVYNVYVGDYVATENGLFQPWDYIEGEDSWSYFDANGRMVPWMATGSWRPVATPSGAMNIWRPIIGRLGDYTSTRLSLEYAGLWPDPHWRRVDGRRVTLTEVQQCTRLDILRHGLPPGSPRDVDTGFHITDTGLSAYVEDVYIEGGFSDEYTSRAQGSRHYRIRTKYGQDMGITADGTTGRQYFYDCICEDAGVYGIYATGDITMTDVTLLNNGWHGEGYYGVGIHCNNDSNIVLSIKNASGNRVTTVGEYTPPPPSVSTVPWFPIRNFEV